MGTDWKDRSREYLDRVNAERRDRSTVPEYKANRNKYLKRRRTRTLIKTLVEKDLANNIATSYIMQKHSLSYEDVQLIRSGKMPSDSERWGPM